MGISPSSAFGLDGHAASPRFITQKCSRFLFLEVSNLDVTYVLMDQDLKYFGATYEDWT